MKRNKIYAWMAAAMTLAACSTNDIADITANDADNVVNIASVTRSGETGNTTAQQMTAPFHLINVTQQDRYNVRYEADYTYNSSTSQYARKDGDLVVWCNIKSDNSSEQMVANEFQAFSPLRTVANEASYTTFQILPDQSTADKLAAADWMTATTTLTKLKADNSVNSLDLNFEHRNAKLHFDVTLKDDVATSALSSEIFKVLGAITPYYNSTDNSKTIEAIVKPKDYSESGTNLIELSININDNTTEPLAVPFPSGLSVLSPGKQYNFDLVIGHNAATISSVSVTDWNNSSIDLGGKDDALFLIPYVTFTSNDEVGFKMTTNNYTISGLEYSVNNGEWTSIPGSGMSVAVTFGGIKGNLRLRGKNTNGTANDYDKYATISFTPSNENSNVKVACTGDIRTLLDWVNYKTVDTSNALFCHLFENCTQLTSAPELPATTLNENCYSSMFSGCKSLTTAPELPATELAADCYSCMFEGCTALTTAPALPATTLADNCYFGMFSECTSLTTAPELKAEILADYCYQNMFNGCESLTTAPKLPATTLAQYCYSGMFWDCTSLTTAPELKAETLADNCYSNMFNGCTSLTTAPALPATALADYCYKGMFAFCKKLQSVTMLATVSASGCLDDWLYEAGTDDCERTLTVASQEAYYAIVGNLPDIWQSGEGKATVIFKDENSQ